MAVILYIYIAHGPLAGMGPDSLYLRGLTSTLLKDDTFGHAPAGP